MEEAKPRVAVAVAGYKCSVCDIVVVLSVLLLHSRSGPVAENGCRQLLSAQDPVVGLSLLLTTQETGYALPASSSLYHLLTQATADGRNITQLINAYFTYFL